MKMRSTRDNTTSPLDEKFDALVKTLLEEWHVPGMSIAVIHGEHTFAKGYGVASFPEEPVTPETLFFAASTTKSFTSAGISLLIDDDANSHSRPMLNQSSTPQTEQLTWKTRISTLIPDEFVLPDPYATIHTTLEDALCHRTGMPDHENSFGPKTTDVRKMTRSLRHLPMTAEFREEFMYNDMMYSAVSYVIETRTKQNMGHFLKERIWNPLGMSKTYWTLEDALAAEKCGDARLARGYAWDASLGVYVAEDMPDFPGVSGAGAIISNVLDYTKWLRCMMTRSAPLSAAGHDSLTTPRIVLPKPGNNPFPGTNLYALGWFVDIYRGEKIVWHSGGWTGFGSIMVTVPGKQWGVVMLGNTSRTSNYVEIILLFELLDVLLGTPRGERMDWGERLRGVVSGRREACAGGRERLYPSVPREGRPMALQLKNYAGVYKHEGYGIMNFVVDGKRLVADRGDMEIAMQVRLEHVSGESWLARLEVKNRDPREIEVVRAKFLISDDEKVVKFGAELEPKMGEKMIWFSRIDE